MSPLMLDHNGDRRPSTKKERPYAIAPARPQDVRRLVDIEFRAFENERVNQVLSYRDYKKPAHFERTVAIYQKALKEQSVLDKGSSRQRSDSKVDAASPGTTCEFKKIVDTETNDVVSFTKFELRAYSREELRSRADIGHEGESLMNRDWFALNERLRRQYTGLSKHCYIGMLATEPRYQHNGAGTMLLEDVLSEADNAGVEVYLEATDTAKPWYERHGFKAIRELRFDPAEYGVKGLGVERQTVMVRGALGRDGDRRSVRSWDAAVAHSEAQLHQ